jgi:UDP-glucose 4-epimerase
MILQSNKLILAGASGFVGARIATDAVHGGYEVHGLSRRGLTGLIHPLYSDRVVDLAEAVALHGLGSSDFLIHLAATVPGKATNTINSQTVVIARNVAQAAAALRIPVVILVSSVAARIAEETPKKARPYGLEKLESEHIFRETLLPEQKLVILRPPAIYGPNMDSSLLLLADAIRRGLPLPLGKASAKRAWLSLGNFSDLILALLSSRTQINRLSEHIICEPADLKTVSTVELCAMLTKIMKVRSMCFPFPLSFLRIAGALAGKSATIESLVGELRTLDQSAIESLTGWRAREMMPDSLAFLAQECS